MKHRKPSPATPAVPLWVLFMDMPSHPEATGLVMGEMVTTWASIKGVRLPVTLLQVGQSLSLGLSGRGRRPRRTGSNVPFQRESGSVAASGWREAFAQCHLPLGYTSGAKVSGGLNARQCAPGGYIPTAFTQGGLEAGSWRPRPPEARGPSAAL